MKIRLIVGVIIVVFVVLVGIRFRGREEGRKPSSLVVLCLGDSITKGGYPSYLQEEFRRIGMQVKVINRGINGHTSGEYLSFMKKSHVLSEAGPDIILLQLGTNDLRIDGDKTDTNIFLSNMNEIITLIDTYRDDMEKTKLILGTIPPINSSSYPFDYGSGKRVVEEINPAIIELAELKADGFSDNYKLFIENPGNLPGIHPDEDGYRLLAKNWLRAILELPGFSGVSRDERLSSLSGRIVFQSNRDGNWEIYVMDADGLNLKRLTDNEWDDEYPVWSPDGQEILFKSDRDGNWEIYKMKADGSGEVRLTDCESRDEDPCWSPDGEKIAFHSGRDGNLNIYTMDLQSKETKRISDSIHREILPAWSPDGERISYTCNKFFGWQVYVMDTDGNESLQLTNQRGACRSDWSPDGKKLAYVSSHADGKGDIWLMNSDGEEKLRLTTDSENYDYYPAWSRDGEKIVFAKSSDKKHGNWEIWIINADGTNPVQVTDFPGQDKFPDWF